MLKCLFNRILEYTNKNKNYNAYKKCNWPPISRKPSLTELNKNWIVLKAYLHGTTLSHATSFRQAYDTNCIV